MPEDKFKNKKKIVVLTGAGISAESGIGTFRDAGGLWEGYDVTEVASPEGWTSNPELVLRFYNERRKQIKEAEPNVGHIVLSELEQDFEVVIITQNIDNLHERAGSSKVIHLHGSIFEAKSTTYPEKIYDISDKLEINIGDTCENGSQLRPNIVWFGEAVPKMEVAIRETVTADLFIVAGTSMVVYPAAGLIEYVPLESPIYVVDPVKPDIFERHNLTFIEENATSGLRKLKGLIY